ncbi:hypothetical protein RI367_002199 [Sorochytrium milnesiophthora]
MRHQQLTLLHLPLELLQEVLILSHSSQLPLVSRRLHALFTPGASVATSVKARFLLARRKSCPVKALQDGVFYRFLDMAVVRYLDRTFVKARCRCSTCTNRRKRQGDFITVKSTIGWPKRLFVQPGHEELVRMLLERGNDVNWQEGFPLKQSVKNGRLDLVRLLLAFNCNVHIKRSFAVALAIKHNQLDVLQCLLTAHPKLYPEDLELAVEFSPASVGLLLEAGCTVSNQALIMSLKRPYSNNQTFSTLLQAMRAQTTTPSNLVLRFAVENNMWTEAHVLMDEGAVPDMDLLKKLQWK